MKNEIKPISSWDKVFLNKRYNLLKKLSINYSSIDSFILIETDGCFTYTGCIYIDKNNYFYFSKRYSKNLEIVKTTEISETHQFIINNIATNNIDNIIYESLNSNVTESSPQYITIAKKKNNKYNIETLILKKDFCIDSTGPQLFLGTHDKKEIKSIIIVNPNIKKEQKGYATIEVTLDNKDSINVISAKLENIFLKNIKTSKVEINYNINELKNKITPEDLSFYEQELISIINNNTFWYKDWELAKITGRSLWTFYKNRSITFIITVVPSATNAKKTKNSVRRFE
jgi:hypothetical protein